MEKHKKLTITINLKYLHQHGMKNLNYHMVCILCQIFKIILSILKKKKHGEYIYGPSVQIYVNKIEIGLHLELKKGIVLNF